MRSRLSSVDFGNNRRREVAGRGRATDIMRPDLALVDDVECGRRDRVGEAVEAVDRVSEVLAVEREKTNPK